MIKTISTSDLCIHLNEVLNHVIYGHIDYVVEKFGEPAVAIISVDDYHLLQEERRQRTTGALREVIAQTRERQTDLDASELGEMIEQARQDFHDKRSRTTDTDS